MNTDLSSYLAFDVNYQKNTNHIEKLLACVSKGISFSVKKIKLNFKKGDTVARLVKPCT